jgi:predicted DNA-binding transcriptional regulator AlpA
MTGVDHLVGVAEVADMFGVSRQRVDAIVNTHDDFPKPEAVLAAGRIWSRSAVEDWARSHLRTIHNRGTAY